MPRDCLDAVDICDVFYPNLVALKWRGYAACGTMDEHSRTYPPADRSLTEYMEY